MFKLQARRLRSQAASLLIAALVAGQPTSALAQDAAEAPASNDVKLAEQRAAQAFEAYQKKDYTTAVALYLEAYNAASSADMLYNIARIYDTRLGDRQLAMTFYRRYIADPGAVADRIKRAGERLLELREAEIAVGERAIKETRSREARPALATESGDRASSSTQLGVVLGATGIAALGVGAGFGLAALAKARTARDLCDGNDCRSQQGVDAAHTATKDATISTIGFAAGGMLLAFGAYLFFSGHKQTEQSTSSLRWGAVATPSQLAVELGGTW